MSNDVIEFLRKRDYLFIKELGQGACGKTILLHDDIIDENFVCKKFSPFCETARPSLFQNFVREIKILHQILHPNIVRVFNYYIYPDDFTGYILMEYISGTDIESHLSQHPETINDIFTQAINGFAHMESSGILHRDIRPQNIMIEDTGELKIIDFGFGKQIDASEDFDKSISLNWWCEVPDEFSSNVYDYSTEVYFLGKLFEGIIQTNNITKFKHLVILRSMCQKDPGSRTQSFLQISRNLKSSKFSEIEFSEEEKINYRIFSNAIESQINNIASPPVFEEDAGKIIFSLTNVQRAFMLEETVPDASEVIGCFLRPPYNYRVKGLDVETIQNFLQLIKSSSPEKQNIILANLKNRLSLISKLPESNDDDLPF